MLRLYPEYKETFGKEIIHDLTYNLRDDFEADSIEESEVQIFFWHAHKHIYILLYVLTYLIVILLLEYDWDTIDDYWTPLQLIFIVVHSNYIFGQTRW